MSLLTKDSFLSCQGPVLFLTQFVLHVPTSRSTSETEPQAAILGGGPGTMVPLQAVSSHHPSFRDLWQFH